MAGTAGSTSSTDGSRSTDGVEAVALGRIVGAHGLRGELRVRASGDDVESLASLTHVHLAPGEGSDAAARALASTARRLEGVRSGRAGECRVALEGVNDRDQAEALRGHGLWVAADALPELEAGEFYAYQLVGCQVVEASDGRVVGTVVRVLETGGRDVLEVETPSGPPALVPAVEPILQEVDLAARRIAVDAPPGLLPDPDAAPE